MQMGFLNTLGIWVLHEVHCLVIGSLALFLGTFLSHDLIRYRRAKLLFDISVGHHDMFTLSPLGIGLLQLTHQ